MIGAMLLALLFGSPGLVVLAAARGRGGAAWSWPTGVAVSAAFGMALAGIVAVALGAVGAYSLPATVAVVGALEIAVGAAARLRLRWPLARAAAVEAVGFLVAVALAGGLFFGHRFEMLLGERDATVYTVSGIGLARQGSLRLRDHTADRIGTDAMRRFYPLPAGAAADAAVGGPLPQYVKYPGFYFLDADRRWIVSQGLPLLPALIAIFYGALGLDGAFVANNAIGVVAVASVFAAGSALVGPLAAVLGAMLLALDLVEVWAARYPVAEILFQMLLFAGFAAYLRGGRLGRALAGVLIAATLFAKVEAALLLPPLALHGIVTALRRRRAPEAAFWAPFTLVALGAVACWIEFQGDYVAKAYGAFASLQSRLVSRYFIETGAWLVLGVGLATLGAIAIVVMRSIAGRRELSVHAGRALAVGVAVFALFGYFVRPHMAGLIAGQGRTFVWLSWYASPLVVLVGFAGIVHFAWTRPSADRLFVLGAALTLAAVFLHFTFVNLIHIYMTRRFVPAALPLLALFFGYAVVTLGAVGEGRRRAAAVAVAALLAAAALQTIVARSRHLYRHREYPGLASSFRELARQLEGKDLVFLSDGKVRNLLGPTLEFVFGIDTLVVWPPAYEREHATIRRWLDDGMAIGALTSEQAIDGLPGGEDFEPIDHPVWWIRVLDQAEDRFPTTVAEDSLVLNRYAAGHGSDPLYELWRASGARVSRELCDGGVRVLGGDPFLVRHVRADCPASGVRGRTMGYLVGDGDAAAWQKTLDAYGVRSVRRSLGGLVLFDEVAPREAPEARPLPRGSWHVEASESAEGATLAADGRLDTRWGSGGPQHPGMSFTIGFPAPTDVSWLRLRMGRFATDRARSLALETTTDGEHWTRREIPTLVDALRWNDGVPEENADGDRDLWIGERGLRAIRLVNLGESSRFDWSIAELELEGRTAR